MRGVRGGGGAGEGGRGAGGVDENAKGARGFASDDSRGCAGMLFSRARATVQCHFCGEHLSLVAHAHSSRKGKERADGHLAFGSQRDFTCALCDQRNLRTEVRSSDTPFAGLQLTWAARRMASSSRRRRRCTRPTSTGAASHTGVRPAPCPCLDRHQHFLTRRIIKPRPGRRSLHPRSRGARCAARASRTHPSRSTSLPPFPTRTTTTTIMIRTRSRTCSPSTARRSTSATRSSAHNARAPSTTSSSRPITVPRRTHSALGSGRASAGGQSAVTGAGASEGRMRRGRGPRWALRGMSGESRSGPPTSPA